MTYRVLLGCSFLVVAVIVLSGCNGNAWLAAAGGRVLVDGVAMPAGSVLFTPLADADAIDEAGRSARGYLADDGSFTLGTREPADGAWIARHWVTLYGPNRIAGIDLPPTQKGQGEPDGRWSLVLLDHQFDVSADGPNQFVINLTSQDLAHRKFQRSDDD